MSICLLLALFTAQAQAQTETLEVWGHDFTMTADGSTITHLTISERDVVDYTGFSLTIVVPKGIHIAQVRSGREYVNDIALNVDRATTTHTIACNMPEEEAIKVIAYSSQNQNFYPDDIDGNPVTDIFTIGLVADPTMVNGVYEVSIIDCKFAQAPSGASKPQAPVTMQMTVTGGVDGTQVNCTIGEAGVSTLILPFDAALPPTMQAFTCTRMSGSTVQTEPQTSIPALTPVLVTAEPGTYSFTGVPTATETTYTEGLLTGVLESTMLTSGYVLQQQASVAFYPVSAERPITVPAYKCYLNYAGSERLIGIEDTLTGILDRARADGKAGATYDMQGRRVSGTAAPGVYIRGNRKIITSKP